MKWIILPYYRHVKGYDYELILSCDAHVAASGMGYHFELEAADEKMEEWKLLITRISDGNVFFNTGVHCIVPAPDNLIAFVESFIKRVEDQSSPFVLFRDAAYEMYTRTEEIEMDF